MICFPLSQVSLDDAKRELDLREVETESLKGDLRAAKQRVEAMREIQSRSVIIPSHRHIII